MNTIKRVTISQKHNSFLWLPSKTGSNSLSWILSYFEFDSFKIENEKLIPYYEGLTHFGHDTFFPPNHQTMIFICSLRNPYERFFSFFKLSCKNNRELMTKDNFRKYLESEFNNENSTISKSKNIFDLRVPDYLIRTENFFEDLISIPFVNNSKLNQTNILKDMCNMKKHKSFEANFEEYLPDDYRILIYENYKKHFELGKYPL